MEVINIRRSVRRFKQNEVESHKIEAMLKAGMQAPSGANQQPWELFAVTDKALLEQLSITSPWTKMVANAPLAIIVAGNTQKLRVPEDFQQDLGACSQNILLEAVNQDLGGTWLSVYPFEEKVSHVHQVLKMPEQFIPYNIIVLGYPLQEKANHFVDRYNPNAVHYNKYEVK